MTMMVPRPSTSDTAPRRTEAGRPRIPSTLWQDDRITKVGNEAAGLLLRCMSITTYGQRENYIYDGDVRRMAGSKSAYKRLTTLLVGWRLLLGDPDGEGWNLPDELWQVDPRPRQKIDPEVRAAVYLAADFLCEECGTDGDLTIDHIVPWSRGGTNDPENLRCLCRSCNSRKGAKV